MLISSTHILEFTGPDGDIFTTRGDRTTENAPDWLRQDSYFEACQKSGWISDLLALDKKLPPADPKNVKPADPKDHK